MDNLTHSLTGLAIARCGASQVSSRATLLLLFSANAPDLDIAAAPWGALRYLEMHRGYTHSLICLPLVAALSVLVTAAIYRQKLPWLRAWLLCCLGVASHLLLDWTNSYGVRLFLPFSSRWLHCDLNSLTDGIVLSALALAAIWPWFASLVTAEIGSRSIPRIRASSVAALSFFVLFDTGRALLHQRAVTALNSRLYKGDVPLSVAALPSASNPFQWTGIVETDAAFARVDFNVLHEFDPDSADLFETRAFDPAIEAARRTEAFRFFQYFSRFPVWSEEPVSLPSGSATRIDLTDLRFGAPDAGAFHCVALIGSQNQVLQSTFTYGSGAALGRNGQ